jgi:hypothetical protein
MQRSVVQGCSPKPDIRPVETPDAKERQRPPIARRRLRSIGLGAALVVSLLGGASTAIPSSATAAPQSSPSAPNSPNRGAGLADVPTSSQGHRVAASDSVAGEAPLPGGGGFWIAYSSGVVRPVGTAVWLGDMSTVHLNQPIVGIAATHDGRGYWLVAEDGGIFCFGDARFFGSTGSMQLNSAVIAMTSTSDGGGYWLLGGDGGIFSFGDARFYGSTGSMQLNQPVEGMTPSPDGRGYWLVAGDGGIFCFGDARFFGSTGSMQLNSAVVAMASTSDGGGYWLLGGDGGVFTFGDAPYHGSAVSIPAAGSAVGIVRAAGDGYWVLMSSGSVLSYGVPSLPSPTPRTFATVIPAGGNPTSSIQPSASFVANCVSGHGGSACDAAALADINLARAGEALGPLALPADFEALTSGAQSVAVADAERTSRGLPAMAENAALDAMAQSGAVRGQDPGGPNGFTWGSNVSWGYRTPLAADFVWMYDDGAGGNNIDCTAAVTSGCWGHRINILAPWGGSMGVGTFDNNSSVQLTELFVESY